MQPGYPPSGQMENNMAMAVLAIVVFWPLGLMAVINSGKVNGLLQQGDYRGAQHALAESKRWTKYALITAAIWWGLSLVCCLGWVLIGGGAALLGSTSG